MGLKYKISINSPFHSYHIFENPDTKLSDSKLNLLVESLLDFVSLIPIKVNVLMIDRDEFKKALGVKSNEDLKGNSERREMREYPYRIMSAQMFKWFANHLKKTKGIGQILTDSRRGGDYQLLKSLNLCKDISGPLPEPTSKLIKEKCNAICFAEKNFLSGGLEITDLISYTSFFKARSTLQTMDGVDMDRLWQVIKNRLKDKRICKISKDEVMSFFKVDLDGVHKYLKSKNN